MLLRLVLPLALLSALLAGCGDDEDDSGGSGSSGPAALTITETEAGDRLKVAVSGPKTPGLTRITFRNQGKRPHSAQIIGIRGERSFDEVFAAYGAAQQAKPIPEWLRAVGGASTTAPGQTTVVTQELAPGTYYVIDDDDRKNPGRGGRARFEIARGEPGGGELPTGGRVTGVDYGFESEGLTAGRTTLVFANEGRQPHHVVAAPILPGKTIADVRKFASSQGQPSGPPPIDFENGFSTAVIDGGRTLATDVRLKKGAYALLCFVSDRQGGPPHVAKGMVAEAKVQ